jgi:putative DNA methylase
MMLDRLGRATVRKKMIEVAIPLDAINKASAREKSIRHGHPSTLHLWWARRPLAACRAVLFCALIDDPDQEGVPAELLERIDRLPLPDPRPVDWDDRPLGQQRRDRLFAFITKLVQWENSNNEEILATARELIRAATDGNPPPVLDPFCGGGSIPLEAQRLGLAAHASDLNPVAVLITKALIEIPPKFANQPPVNPADRDRGMGAPWKGAAGLAADVRYYGKWMRDEADRRIGHLHPKAKLPDGGEATVIAWLWARTVTCPNPACGARMPLVSSFDLSTKSGKRAWVEPAVDRAAKTVRFQVRTGSGVTPPAPKTGRGASFRCLVCEQVADDAHAKAQGMAGKMGAQLMAMVAEGRGGRVYLAPSAEHEEAALVAVQDEVLSEVLPNEPRAIWCTLYGLKTHADLFTPRQLVTLTTFSNLVAEVRDRARRDAAATGRADDGTPLSEGGIGATAYADAVATYLAFGVDKMADYNSTLVAWSPTRDQAKSTFARQGLPMVWDYAEVNPFSGAAGDLTVSLEGVARAASGIQLLPLPGQTEQRDATQLVPPKPGSTLIATDPPYYDNIGYADLSDFFYVWLRRSLRPIYPELFGTVVTPKDDEMIASPYRHAGGADQARRFFEERLAAAFRRMHAAQHPDYPLTLFYAFKQSESPHEAPDQVEAVSTGWETMLEGLVRAGFQIDGTWPMRTERAGRSNDIGTNALASSIVLACRPRPDDALIATRRDFLAALRRELPPALKILRRENIAPVDLAQAAIGPGMAVYSRYREVQEPNGERLPVRAALGLINQTLDEALGDGDYDPETRWAVTWYSQNGTADGPFGDANTLANARATSVAGMEHAGIVQSKGGIVRLLRPAELPGSWDPAADHRFTVWETAHHLIRVFAASGSEEPVADLLAKALARRADVGELVRELAYQLFVIAERRGWAAEALAYNDLVVAWPSLSRLAASRTAGPPPARMF